MTKTNNCFFVDLYTPSLALYAKPPSPLTIEGAHLQRHARSTRCRTRRENALRRCETRWKSCPIEKVRAAVLDKDFYWFNHYRTVDGYNVYGRRSQLKYVDDVQDIRMSFSAIWRTSIP